MSDLLPHFLQTPRVLTSPLLPVSSPPLSPLPSRSPPPLRCATPCCLCCAVLSGGLRYPFPRSHRGSYDGPEGVRRRYGGSGRGHPEIHDHRPVLRSVPEGQAEVSRPNAGGFWDCFCWCRSFTTANDYRYQLLLFTPWTDHQFTARSSS